MAQTSRSIPAIGGAVPTQSIQRKIRELLGFTKGQRVPSGTAVELWLGISTDEAIRMKPSRDRWIQNRYPLIEARMSRKDCLHWWNTRYDRPLERSACMGCPYQSRQRWVEIKRRWPELFAEAVEIDAKLRGRLAFAKEPYLHPRRGGAMGWPPPGRVRQRVRGALRALRGRIHDETAGSAYFLVAKALHCCGEEGAMAERAEERVMKKTVAAGELDAPYQVVFGDVSKIVDAARDSATRSVNAAMTAAYWLIGHRIVEFEQSGEERATYGTALMERLAADLTQRFGRGFSRQNIQYMRLFYVSYPSDQIRQALSGKSDATFLEIRLGELLAAFPLPWSAYVRLLSVKNTSAREFYGAEALRGGWSVRQLDRQINSQFYERTALSKNKAAMLTEGQKPRHEDRVEIKDPFVLAFLNLKDEYSESDLEEALIRHLETFLLELGGDFCFMGRQRRLRIGDKWYRVDLLFFHRRLRCLVVIDLKIGGFTHADATGVLPFFGGPEVIVEVKTRGPEAYKRWQTLGAERSHPESVAQAALYTYGKYGEARDVVIATMDTGSRQWDTETIPAERVEDAMEAISFRLGELADHYGAHGQNPDALPERDFRAGSWQCRTCPFLNTCQPGAAEERGETDESPDIEGREVSTEEAREAVRAYLEAQEALREPEQAKRRARAPRYAA